MTFTHDPQPTPNERWFGRNRVSRIMGCPPPHTFDCMGLPSIAPLTPPSPSDLPSTMTIVPTSTAALTLMTASPFQRLTWVQLSVPSTLTSIWVALSLKSCGSLLKWWGTRAFSLYDDNLRSERAVHERRYQRLTFLLNCNTTLL